MPPKTSAPQPASPWWPAVWQTLLGFFLGLCLLKFGNPAILDKLVSAPTNTAEYIFQPWPMRWGLVMLALLGALGIAQFRVNRQIPQWIFWLPTVWLGWQILAGVKSVDPKLSHPTLLHFTATVGIFYLGACGWRRESSFPRFFLGLLLGYALVLWFGLDQHFGGLEATRKMFYEQPNWQQYPQTYILKINSNRIFSTLVYPNALAGAILLLAPLLLFGTWHKTAPFGKVPQGVVTGLLAYASAACLFWSGSKAGWLIALALGVVLILHLPFPRHYKIIVGIVILLGGLAGFTLKFTDYFRKGATSVSARFDYWQAAAQTAAVHPVLGTGPGTFGIPYAKIKKPESEMAQLTHNDYLQQASDSGIIGFLTYITFWMASLALLYRKTKSEPLWFACWLGLLGWTLQGFVEFGLYIPALSWTAYLFVGWLWAMTGNGIDKPTTSQ